MVLGLYLLKAFIIIKDSGLMGHFQEEEQSKIKVGTLMKVISWREKNKDSEKNVSKMDNTMKDSSRKIAFMAKVFNFII